jgi:heat shock protein HtpX
MLRLILFFGTNIAVLVVLAIVCKILGIDQALAMRGQNLTGLLIMSAVLGMAGSFISLAMSKWIAKRSTGAQVIDTPRNPTEIWLKDTVARQADAAGIGMPEVAIFDSPDLNAFATGMNKNNALVAVSTGLLRGMSQDEVEAVLAHEVSHVANGDMVTMGLVQGVLNTFVIFFSRIIGMIVDGLLRRDSSSGPGIGYFLASMVAQVVLGILASIIAMWFSRWREFRADAGSAALSSREKMIAALERLRAQHAPVAPLPREVEAMGISGDMGRGLKRLFMSHPPLEERIQALRRAN